MPKKYSPVKIPLLFTTSILLYSFINQQQSNSKLFLVEYSKGLAWNNSKDFSGQQFSSHHSKHLGSLRSNSLISFGARYDEKGIILLKANDSVSAHQIVHSDSSVISGIFKVSIRELHVFYPINSK